MSIKKKNFIITVLGMFLVFGTWASAMDDDPILDPGVYSSCEWTDDGECFDDRAGVIAERFRIGAQGMGWVSCCGCSTRSGCTYAVYTPGTKCRCVATPASSATFSHWTANGNFASDQEVFSYASRGSLLQGHFR